MSTQIPGILVSSTYFDLRQIRSDLADFIEKELGYRALLFEQPTFPIDPDVDTIENCRRRVEHDADVLILVIGGRYGYVVQDVQKSVTNLEYLAARSKGIPIYAFVEKRVLALLPTWERNANADFASDVDNPALFDFVKRIRSQDNVWVHGFDNAKDIVTVLRVQFAYLFSEALRTRLRLISNPHAKDEGLSGKAFRIALERPKLWEYRLFCQVLIDEVDRHRDARREKLLGIALGAGEDVPLLEFGGWMGTRLDEQKRTIPMLENLVNKYLQDAFGPPGEPGKPADIIFAARKLAEFYRNAIDWSQRLLRTHVDDRCRKVVEAMAGFVDDMLLEVESFGPKTLRQLEETLAQIREGETKTLRMTMTFRLSNLDKFKAAMKEMNEQLGIPPDANDDFTFDSEGNE